MQDLAKPAEPPRPIAAGVWLAGTWLVVTTLGCVASALTMLTPEVLVNVAIVTVPLYVSAWASVIAAYVARRRAQQESLAITLAGGGIGLVFGVAGLLVAYEMLWPGFL